MVETKVVIDVNVGSTNVSECQCSENILYNGKIFSLLYGCYENLLHDVDLLYKYHEEPMDDTEDSIIDLRRVPLEVLDYPL